MDDLMAKLQSVLNDKESMKQISELAGMLTGSAGESNDSPPAPAASVTQTAPAQPQQNNMDFSALLNGLGLGNEAPPQNSAPQSSGFDMSKLIQIQGIMAQANKPDKNVDLLLALRPLLKEENQIKIDRLVKIFKLFAIYPALKESGLLGGDLFGLL